METTSKKSSVNIVGGCIFAVLAIRQLYITIYYGYTLGDVISGPIWSVLKAVALVIIAVALFTKIKNPLASVGFAVLAVMSAKTIYQDYKYGWYLSVDFSFDFSKMIPGLLIVAAYIIAAIMGIILLMADESKKGLVRKYWFIPAATYAISILFQFVRIIGRDPVFRLRVDFWDFLTIAGLLFSMMWMASSDARTRGTISLADGMVIDGATSKEEGYRGIAEHVLLLVFTFGIWYLIWIYKTTAYLNCVEDEEPRNPTTKLLLCMFIPFYTIYWVYKSAQRIDKLANAKGISSDLSAICLILAIFIGIIPPILMQDRINAIVTTNYRRSYYGEREKVEFVQNDVADELKKFKELFDSGIITEEEFTAKKKQLLGL